MTIIKRSLFLIDVEARPKVKGQDFNRILMLYHYLIEVKGRECKQTQARIKLMFITDLLSCLRVVPTIVTFIHSQCHGPHDLVPSQHYYLKYCFQLIKYQECIQRAEHLKSLSAKVKGFTVFYLPPLVDRSPPVSIMCLLFRR